MAYENVQLGYKNFCIGPIGGTFCTIDHDNDVMKIVNDNGVQQGNLYTLSSGIGEVKSLEYVGPRDTGDPNWPPQGSLGEDLPFVTLERTSSFEYVIRKWKLSASTNKLNLDATFSGINNGSYSFNCYDMSVEHYQTDFNGATTTGTGKIKLTTYSNVESGDKLLLGPSTDTDNMYALEEVEVTTISGGWVYITASGITPPQYEYQDEDPITYYKNIFMFSDTGQNNDSTKGSLYRIDPNDGTILDVQDDGLYSGVRSSAWSRDYQSIGMVKGFNLLYVDPNSSYQIQGSQVLTNVEDDDATIIPVYDLIFNSNNIYRLQQKTTRRNDAGVKSTEDWAPEYNYQQDAIAAYTSTIALSVDPDGIVLHPDFGEGQVTITAAVKDQFGVGILGKQVDFSKGTGSGDPNGYFTGGGQTGQATTNASGIATIQYTTGDYDQAGTNKEINIKAKTDGALPVVIGSQYIWDGVLLFLYSNFTTELINLTQKATLSGTWPTEGSDLYTEIGITQISGVESACHIDCFSRIQFPGGMWGPGGAPTDDATIIRQLEDFESEVRVDQLDNEFENETNIRQLKEVENDLQLSQTYISKHLSSGHIVDVDIDQFTFIQEAIPAFWSEKNPVNTNIYIHLRKAVADLNQSTLVFQVREVSYAGDTGYITVTPQSIVSDDSGGLRITYNPPNDFHYNATVYVNIEIYDTAGTPNIILTDYWFKIIPDYKAPYITNENPGREEEDVAVDTNIEFDILDIGVGVNINSLEFYVNNRIKSPTVSAISGGYHVSYNPPKDFYYGETVEITVKVNDASPYQNTLYDMWRFYCVGSTGPWIDRDSFVPRNCTKGAYRKLTNISANVYGIDGTGVNQSSILVTIGGKDRDIKITPIIYRID